MNTDEFFDQVRASFGRLSQLQVDGFNAVLAATEGESLAFRAYELATAWHETNGTMQPVREAYWLSEAWRKTNLRYYPWYGRGLVQLTWEPNYAKADAEAAKAGLIESGALLADPDLAMRPDIAGFVLRRGMDEGWFSTKKLADYLPAEGLASVGQFTSARAIINGTDRALMVAGYALNFQRVLGAAA